jgi:hypothetical protein
VESEKWGNEDKHGEQQAMTFSLEFELEVKRISRPGIDDGTIRGESDWNDQSIEVVLEPLVAVPGLVESVAALVAVLLAAGVSTVSPASVRLSPPTVCVIFMSSYAAVSSESRLSLPKGPVGAVGTDAREALMVLPALQVGCGPSASAPLTACFFRCLRGSLGRSESEPD